MLASYPITFILTHKGGGPGKIGDPNHWLPVPEIWHLQSDCSRKSCRCM